MKRKICLEKAVALLSVPVIAMILLPSLVAVWSGKMNFPTTHKVCLAAETITSLDKGTQDAVKKC